MPKLCEVAPVKGSDSQSTMNFPLYKGKKGRKVGHKSICMIVVLLTTITLTDTENMCLVLEKEQERRLLLLRTAAGAQIVQC